MWGFLKEKVYSNSPRSLEDFTRNIEQALAGTDQLTLRKYGGGGSDHGEACLKAQLHWASLLATRLRIYSLLLNSLYVITLSCKVAARSANANEVEGWATFVATRWRF